MKDIKDDIIKDLEEKVEMEKSVKQSEVMMNADLKSQITKLELSLSVLSKLNGQFLDKIVHYKNIIKKLTS
jgi:hypothetical protein|tara:strand:- start:4260 stop:4472 length:213 start_codon:yes stop_codon:yes gene_type:complete